MKLAVHMEGRKLVKKCDIGHRSKIIGLNFSFQILLLSLLIALLPAISNARRNGDPKRGSNKGGERGGGSVRTANGEFSNFISEEELSGPIDFSNAQQQADGSLCVTKTKLIDKEN